MEEEVQRYANDLQRRRDKAPEIAIYGKGKPNVTGGSGDNESVGGIQGHTSLVKSTGAVHSEGVRGSSADITLCSEPEEYDTGSFRHLTGSPVSGVIQSGSQSSDE